MEVQALAAAGDWEAALFRALNLAGSNLLLDAIMFFFTTIALPYVLAFVSVEIWRRGRHGLAFDFLVLLLVAVLVTEAIKFATGRPRPCSVLADVHAFGSYTCAAETDPAFPSGHASRAFAGAALLWLGMSRRAGLTMTAVAVLAGVSRIWLGVHWPTDVLAGALLGVGLALLVREGTRRSPAYARSRGRVVAFFERAVRRAG